ncbi:MAG: hypothetical protein ACR2PS_06975, partial [Pseudomonadales bacterium]
MENQRLLIWATFGMLLWMTYQAWVTDNAPPPAPVNTADQVAPPADAGLPALPSADDSTAAPALADQAPTL